MLQPIEFGYFVKPASERARGHAFGPALRRALDIVHQSFTSLWVADHFMYDGVDSHEAWVILSYAAALAPEIMLGPLVSCNSYRSPALVAKMGASLQSLSRGHFVLGYGAGWKEDEYVAYGYDFPSPAVRIAMLEEGLQIIRALWRDDQPTFHGQYYHIDHASCEPRPTPVPPIMIGGDGELLTLRVVARHADWWNCYARTPEVARHKLNVLQQHCASEGRDFGRIRKTWSGSAIIDRNHRSALRRAGDRLREDQSPIAGDPTAVAERIQQLAELGFDLFQLSFDQFPDTSDLELFVADVMPRFLR